MRFALLICLSAGAYAEQRIENGGLALVVDDKDHTVSMSYKGILVANDLAKTQVYSIGPKGQWETLLEGPTGAQEISVNGSEIKSIATNSAGDIKITTVLRLLSSNKVDIAVKLDTPFVPRVAGLQLGILSAYSEWMRQGRWSSSRNGEAEVPRQLPSEGRNDDSRFLAKNQKTVTVEGELLSITARGKGEAGVSLADMRGTPWDVKQTFLLYESIRPLIPGHQYSREYSVTVAGGIPNAKHSPDGRRNVAAEKHHWTLKELGAGFGTSSGTEVPVRGQVVELVKPALKDVALFRRYLDAVSEVNGNTVVIYHDPVHVALLRDRKIEKTWWTEKELRELIAYANGLGIRVIPGMWSKFRPSQFQGIMSPTAGANFYCPSNDSAYQEIFSLYAKLLDIYHTDLFLIGHDEIIGLEGCARSGETTTQTLIRDLLTIHGWMNARKVRLIIWGDMLLSSHEWNSVVGSAHGNDNRFGSVDAESVVSALPRDVLIMDWHYEIHQKYPSIDYFRKHGFEVWGAAWYKTANAANLVNSVREYGATGIVGTDWGFWSTLNPSTTSLAPIVAGGLAPGRPLPDGEAFTIAFADALRAHADVRNLVPLDLEHAANSSLSDESSGDGVGFADLGSGFDLRMLPRGDVKVGNLIFRIRNNAVGNEVVAVECGDLGKHTSTYPRDLVVPLGSAKFETIAILHSAYLEFPQNSPRKLGAYELEYSDGTRSAMNIVENYNVTDFRSAAGIRKNVWGTEVVVDELVGSVPAWKGVSASHMPLNVQALIWKNPSPSKSVRQIKIVGENIHGRCRVAVVGMSLSK